MSPACVGRQVPLHCATKEVLIKLLGENIDDFNYLRVKNDFLECSLAIVSGVPFPSPEDLPDLGLNPSPLHLLHWQVDSLSLAPLGSSQPY